MGVKCLAQEHNSLPRPGLEPGTPDPESSALTIRPPRFHGAAPLILVLLALLGNAGLVQHVSRFCLVVARQAA